MRVKKKLVISGVAILSLLVLAAVCYSMPKTFGKNIDPSEVDHINVFDGNTGVAFLIEDPQDIQYIVENVQSRPMKRAGLSWGKMGYGFRLSYVDGRGQAILPDFLLNSEDAIRKDPFLYRCDGGLCFAYLQDIENRTGN